MSAQKIEKKNPLFDVLYNDSALPMAKESLSAKQSK